MPATGGGQLVWSTVFGGTFDTTGTDLLVEGDGDVLLTGSTRDRDLPTTRGAYDRTLVGAGLNGIEDHYLARLAGDGRSLLYSSYLGGSAAEGLNGVFLAGAGDDRVVVAGNTGSADFPTTPGVIDTTHVMAHYPNSTLGLPDEAYVAGFTLVNAVSEDRQVAAPALLSPADGFSAGGGMLAAGGQVLLDWSDVADPSGVREYEYEVNRHADFAPGFLEARGYAAESQVLAPPRDTLYGTFYWRVRALDNAGNIGSWSGARSFTLGDPGAPIALAYIDVADDGDVFTGTVVQSGTATGQVGLTGRAPAGGAVVRLRALSPDGVVVPETVTVPAGEFSATFPVRINANDVPIWEHQFVGSLVEAIFGGVTRTGGAGATRSPERAQVASVRLDIPDVIGGHTVTATATLQRPAPPGGAVLRLFSSKPDVAQVPEAVTVPAGATGVTFPVTTAAPRVPLTVSLAVQRGPLPEFQTFLLVKPPGAVVVESVTLERQSVTGGTQLWARVRLREPAPASGVILTARSDDPAVVLSDTVGFRAGEVEQVVPVSTTDVAAATQVTITFAHDTTASAATLTVTPRLGRYVFYNNSVYDGGDPAADARDDGAVAGDKQPLLPGRLALAANVTGYSRGINGIIVDLPHAATPVTAADFEFAVSTDGSAWRPAPRPSAVTRRPGAAGVDRVTVTWADGTIVNTWLRSTVLANANTGLPQRDVFYFGNLVGETGNTTTAMAVNAIDLGLVRSKQLSTAPSDLDRFDFNRDGRINAVDLGIARANQLHALSPLSAPPPALAAGAAERKERAAAWL